MEMRDMDGAETIKGLRALSPSLSILAMSAGDTDALEAVRKQGADEIIAKPFRVEQVLDKVLAALGG
jgi:DNA-binding response OmpR family regulator